MILLMLKNSSTYLKEHTVQVEVVIITSLIAVTRKLIILDLEIISGTVVAMLDNPTK